MKEKLSNQDFLNRLNNVNNKILPLEEYKSYHEKIKCRCLVDGYEWEVSPAKLLQGRGCPICGGSKKLTHEEFKARLKEINPNLKLIGEYVNSNTPIEIECLIDRYRWKARPYHLNSGEGCPKCALRKASERYSKGLEKFKKELKEISPEIEVLGEYKNEREKIECKCLKCGYKWSSLPINLLKGRGCPRCKSSMGENAIERWLIKNGYDYKKEYSFEGCKDNKKLRFDFYLENLRIAIEFDGQQHFIPVKWKGHSDIRKAEQDLIKVFKRDEIKNEFCKTNNIKLLRIPYYNYKYINVILSTFFLKNREALI